MNFGMRRLLITAALVGSTSSAVAQVAPTTPTVSPEQIQVFEQIVHDYIMKHPEVITAALDQAKEKAKADRAKHIKDSIQSWHRELVGDPDSPVGGNPDGDVTMVEFFDYRCPYCKGVEPSIEALLKEDTKLRIVYKEFPILGPASVFAARVALAARKQGKYDKFHTAMMATKGESEITESVVLAVAQSIGLDIDRLRVDVQSPDIDTILDHDFALAEGLDIQFTPGIVIGDTIADGRVDLDALKQLIAAARQIH
jgi:protein-disulfide isomerase